MGLLGPSFAGGPVGRSIDWHPSIRRRAADLHHLRLRARERRPPAPSGEHVLFFLSNLRYILFFLDLEARFLCLENLFNLFFFLFLSRHNTHTHFFTSGKWRRRRRRRAWRRTGRCCGRRGGRSLATGWCWRSPPWRSGAASRSTGASRRAPARPPAPSPTPARPRTSSPTWSSRPSAPPPDPSVLPPLSIHLSTLSFRLGSLRVSRHFSLRIHLRIAFA